MNRFCSECGYKMEDDQIFCPECGAKNQPAGAGEQQQPVQHQVPAPTRKPLSFKKKLSLALSVLLAGGLVAGHQIIKANTEPEQKVNGFLQKLYAGETDSAMADVILPENAKTDLGSFQEFLVDQDLTDFKSRLYEAADGVTDDGITRIVLHENGTELFRVKESKFIGMYPGIEIEAIPKDVELVADVKGMQFTLGETTVSTENGEQELGKYLPGVYACSLSMENGDIEQMVESECGILEDKKVVLDFSIQEMGAEISSDQEDAIVYINNESTGKTVKDLPLVGPIDNGKTLDLHVEKKDEKGELQQSEVITVGAGSFAQFSSFSEEAEDTNDEVEEEIEEETAEKEIEESFTEGELRVFISDFRSAYEMSLNQKEFYYVEDFLENGSIARKEVIEFIGDIGSDYYMYDFLVDEVVAYEILEDKAFVTTYEEFDFTNHLYEVTNYKRSKKYEVHLVGGNPRIAKINIIDTKRKN